MLSQEAGVRRVEGERRGGGSPGLAEGVRDLELCVVGGGEEEEVPPRAALEEREEDCGGGLSFGVEGIEERGEKG